MLTHVMPVQAEVRAGQRTAKVTAQAIADVSVWPNRTIKPFPTSHHEGEVREMRDVRMMGCPSRAQQYLELIVVDVVVLSLPAFMLLLMLMLLLQLLLSCCYCCYSRAHNAGSQPTDR